MANEEFFRNFASIDAVDAHAAGEPIRIITGGLPVLEGSTILERAGNFAERCDRVRTLLMKEPRGHREMFGSAIVPPATDDGDIGIIFMHNEGMSTMCGHGMIGTLTTAAELGLIPVQDGKNCVKVDAPAGRIVANIEMQEGRAERVSFSNVPAFVYAEKVRFPISGIGEVEAAIAYGGAFYIIIEEEKLGLRVLPKNAAECVERAMELKRWANENLDIRHPVEQDIHGIYGVLITSPVVRTDVGCRSRHVCVFAEGSTDRSPCGTGTSARSALLVSRGELKIGETFEAASIINTKFSARVLAVTTICKYKAIIPEISGTAWITGFHRFVVDPADPLQDGFLLPQ